MRPFNLASLIQSKEIMTDTDFQSYLDYMSLKFKSREMNCLENLYSELSPLADLNNFYLGYEIPQIGKEFDLLRFGENEVINIELKSESTLEVSEQLKKNRYYLSFIDKQIHTFTYISDVNELYVLEDEGVIKKINFDVLIDLLERQDVTENVNLDEIFVPSNYLVSPFNSTEKFIENNYFLTDKQRNIKKSILESFESSDARLVAISGEPGTGKTLLTYDIVKELRETKKVSVIHCANLNAGQNFLISEEGWDIFSVKNIDTVINNDSYEAIIVDEAQRMFAPQLEKLHQHILDNNLKCIFSYDGKQCFSDYEFRRNNPQKIEEEFKATKHTLTKKIRTNKEISMFVSNLFNPRQGRLEKEYESVELQYFTREQDILRFTDSLGRNGWQAINYTPSSFYQVSYNRYQEFREPKRTLYYWSRI